MNSENVPQEQQVQLLQKIQNGELIDAANPEKQSLIPKDYFKFTNGETQKKFVFPDGSFTKVSAIPITLKNKHIEVIGDEAKVNALLKSNLQISFNKKSFRICETGSGPMSLWIQRDTVYTGGGFQASFTLVPNGLSYFRNISSPNTWAIGGTCPKDYYELAYDRQYEISSCEAIAHFRWTYIFYGGLSQENWKTILCLSGNQYWAYITM